MVQMHPCDVCSADGERSAAVVFHVPDGPDLSIAVPDARIDLVRAALDGRSRGPSLFDLWCASYGGEGQYTEVIVEAVEREARLSVVIVSGGMAWRTPLDPVDAILTGLDFNLPFFMTDATLPERLPKALHLPWPVRTAALRGARPLHDNASS